MTTTGRVGRPKKPSKSLVATLAKKFDAPRAVAIVTVAGVPMAMVGLNDPTDAEVLIDRDFKALFHGDKSEGNYVRCTAHLVTTDSTNHTFSLGEPILLWEMGGNDVIAWVDKAAPVTKKPAAKKAPPKPVAAKSTRKAAPKKTAARRKPTARKTVARRKPTAARKKARK